MTCLYSHAGDCSLNSNESDYEDGDESQYGVYWKTESILAHLSASTSASVQHQPPALARDALSMSSTPVKTVKRNTTAASLPSPSASGAFHRESGALVAGGAVRALRERKKRTLRSSSEARQKVNQPSSSAVDAQTLAAMGKLEQRLKAKSRSQTALVATTTPKANAVAAKGKAREVPKVSGAPAKVATIQPRITSTIAPTRRPDQSFTASKPTFSSVPKAAPAAPRVAQTPVSTLPPPGKTTPPSADSDEFDSYLDNDDSFELALSQLDSPALSAPSRAPAPVAAPSARSSARLAAPVQQPIRALRPVPQLFAAGGRRVDASRAVRPAFPIDSPASASSTSSRSNRTINTDSPLRPRTLTAQRSAAPAPAFRSSASAAKPLTAPSPPIAPAAPARVSTRSRMTSASGTTIVVSLSQLSRSESQKSLEEVRAMAEREIEALVKEGVADGWSDDEDF